MDRGLTKRTYAAVQDAVVVLGCPLLEQTMAPVDVAEGLADALALASRSPAPAVATLGTSGMSSAIIAQWLATSPDTRVWARPGRSQGRTGAARAALRARARAPGERRRRHFLGKGNCPAAQQSRPPVRLEADEGSPESFFGQILTMFAAWVADQELESIKRRTRDGLERARQQGKVLGPPRKVGPGQLAAMRRMREGGASLRMIASDFECSPSTVMRALRREGVAP